MQRYVFALVVAIVSYSTAAAQPPAIPPTSYPRPPFPPARWMFSPTPGVFYWDSGEYLLGGTLGAARSTGTWTMQYPPFGSGAAGFTGYDPAAAAIAGACASCGRRLHH